MCDKLIYSIKIFIYCSIFMACNASNKNYIKLTNNDFKCNYLYKEDKKVKYECYTIDGDIIESGCYLNDSIIIEKYKYYTSGNIKEYEFYNIKGQLRYSRSYNVSGDVIEENGDFFSQIIIKENKVNLGDSFIVNLYIANPPNTEFKVYGIYKNKRYDLKNRSNTNFISKHIILQDKIGVFVFDFEIDFIDKITGKVQTRKDNVIFEVK